MDRFERELNRQPQLQIAKKIPSLVGLRDHETLSKEDFLSAKNSSVSMKKSV